MNYTNRRARLTIGAGSSLLLACLVMATSGCSASTQADSVEGTPGVSESALTPAAFNLEVYFTDNRVASNVTVTLQGTDGVTGVTTSDWENVGGDIPGAGTKPVKTSLMSWQPGYSNPLVQGYFGQGLSDPYSGIDIKNLKSGVGGTFYKSTRITVRAYINGACHEDFQDIGTWSGNVTLQFNGWGANWDGSCYRGDLLKAYP